MFSNMLSVFLQGVFWKADGNRGLHPGRLDTCRFRNTASDDGTPWLSGRTEHDPCRWPVPGVAWESSSTSCSNQTGFAQRQGPLWGQQQVRIPKAERSPLDRPRFRAHLGPAIARDLWLVARTMKTGGEICCDNYEAPKHPGVTDSVNHFCEETEWCVSGHCCSPMILAQPGSVG